MSQQVVQIEKKAIVSKTASKKQAKAERKAAKKREIKRKRRVKKLFIIIAVLLLLLMAIFVAIIVHFLTKNETKKDDTIQYSIDDLCHKDCGYNPYKFVPNCYDDFQCASLVLRMTVDEIPQPNKGRTIIKLRFQVPDTVVNKAPKVIIPDGTPCERNGFLGRCKYGQCITLSGNELRELLHFLKLEAINGGWETYEVRNNEIKCIEQFMTNSYFTAYSYDKNYQCIENRENCYPYKFEYFACTNPYPSSGGKPCWTENDTLSTKNWPMQFSNEPCIKCSKYKPNDFLSCNEKPNTDICDFDKSKSGNKESEPCCLFDDFGFDFNHSLARCLFSQCVPIGRRRK